MAFLYVCDACKAGDHNNCEGAKDTPPPDSEICGGGVCICGAHDHDVNDDLVVCIREQKYENN